MGRTLLMNATLLDPEAERPCDGALLVEDGRIRARLRAEEAVPEDALRVDLRGRGLSPGFVDLHFHGSVVFHDAAGFDDALRTASASLLRHGTTAFLATTVARPMTQLEESVTRLASLVSGGSWRGAAPIGIHLEGPWINPAAAGAQPLDAIAPFTARRGERLLSRGEGLIRVVTFAPEIEGAEKLQAALARRGIVAALGHSLADPAAAVEAVERGARHVTHLFNAMGALHQREPGLAAVALSDDRLSCDLICDGVHLHPSMVAVAARAKGERLTLITDRVDPPEPGAGPRSFGSGWVHDDGTVLRTEDGRLAGSRVSLDEALRKLRQFTGADLLESLASCTVRPARVLGIEGERGTLRAGARADFAILDDAQRVCETWIAGRRVWAKGSAPAAETW